MTRRLSGALGIAAVLLVGTLARIATWNQVLTQAGLRFLADSDPHYHVLQAERIVRDGLGAAWFDPLLNWPYGARVIWPPLFDLVIASLARAWAGPTVGRETLELVAAGLPVVLGVSTLGLVAALAAALLGPGRGWGPALLVALLPGHVAYSAFGRGDQHVAEVFLFCWVLLAFVGTWSAENARGRLVAGVLLGVGVALAFWNWMGSALHLLVPLAFTGLAHVAFDAEDGAGQRAARGLAIGLGTGAALLAITIAAWAPPGALGRGDLFGITGAHVAIVLCGAAFGLLLVAFRSLRRARVGPRRRVLEVFAAALVSVAAVWTVFPAMRTAIGQGIRALGASDAWYSEISEFQHLLFSCHTSLWSDFSYLTAMYGAGLAVAVLSVPGLRRRWRDPNERPRALLLAMLGTLLVLLALYRRRFAPYATVAVGFLSWEGVVAAARAVADRTRMRVVGGAAMVAGVALVVGPSLRAVVGEAGRIPEPWIEAMQWLGRQAAVPGREGVMGDWALGHLARYYGGKPVVASPFGTEGGIEAMPDLARFELGTSGPAAEALLTARHVGFVVLSDPVVHAFWEQALAGLQPAIAERECSIAQGKIDSIHPVFLTFVAPRLYYFDALAGPDGSAPVLDGFRLLYETPSEVEGPDRPNVQIKIFGVVAGARVVVGGASASSPVTIETRIRTNRGRVFDWRTVLRPDASGRVEARLPYATGWNGAVDASPWRISQGPSTTALVLSDQEVTSGARVALELSRGRSSGAPVGHSSLVP